MLGIGKAEVGFLPASFICVWYPAPSLYSVNTPCQYPLHLWEVQTLSERKTEIKQTPCVSLFPLAVLLI